jgi:O-antigen/teichoic acid export membrane protein
VLSRIQNKLNTFPRHYLQIGKNAGLLFGLSGLQRLFGLATTYFLVRMLSQESYGEYNFVLSAIAVLSLFALPGMNNAIMQSVARGNTGAYRKALPLTFFSSLLGSLVLIGFGVWYVNQNDNEFASSFFLASALFPFATGLDKWASIKVGREEFASIARIRSSASLLTSLLVIGGIHLVPGNILVPIGILLLVKATLNLILTYTSIRKIGKDQPIEKDSLAYGIKTSFYGGIGIVAKHIDKFLIFYFLSPSAMAIYVAAQIFPELVKQLIKTLATVIAPRFAKHEFYTKRLDSFIKFFSFSAAAVLILFAFTLLPWLMVLIFGESYAEAVPYSQALMCTVAIAGSVPLRIRFIKSKLDSKSFRKITLIRSTIQIASNSIFIPTIGLAGAVVTAFIVRITTTATVHLIIKKNYLSQGEAL